MSYFLVWLGFNRYMSRSEYIVVCATYGNATGKIDLDHIIVFFNISFNNEFNLIVTFSNEFNLSGISSKNNET